MKPAGSAAEARARTAPVLTHTWHRQKTNTGSVANNANRASRLPVAPDAVGELHEREGQIQAEEEKQISGGFICQDRPERDTDTRNTFNTRPPSTKPAVAATQSPSRTGHRSINDTRITHAFVPGKIGLTG